MTACWLLIRKRRACCWYRMLEPGGHGRGRSPGRSPGSSIYRNQVRRNWKGPAKMTTNASKHGLRAAAKERSNRHAQRTPLPPKPGQVEEVVELLAEWIGHNAETDRAEEAAPASGTKSLGKAEAFAVRARAAKWEVSTEVDAEHDTVELTATRNGETIVQAWAGGVWQYPSSFYGYGDRNTRPRNASGAVKLLERSPEEAQADASKVAANKHFRKAEPKDIEVKLEEAQRRLPFDPALAADELILAAVNGQALVWYNSLSRGQESALVSRKGARISVTADGKRVLTFCCPVTGYRSCYVSSLLRVGKGKRPTAGVQGAQTVEVA